VQCFKCQNISWTFDPSIGISVPISTKRSGGSSSYGGYRRGYDYMEKRKESVDDSDKVNEIMMAEGFPDMNARTKKFTKAKIADDPNFIYYEPAKKPKIKVLTHPLLLSV
jgi:hypothetical protein